MLNEAVVNPLLDGLKVTSNLVLPDALTGELALDVTLKSADAKLGPVKVNGVEPVFSIVNSTLTSLPMATLPKL